MDSNTKPSLAAVSKSRAARLPSLWSVVCVVDLHTYHNTLPSRERTTLHSTTHRQLPANLNPGHSSIVIVPIGHRLDSQPPSIL